MRLDALRFALAGKIIGAFFGFGEGFVWLGALAYIYNKFVKRNKI